MREIQTSAELKAIQLDILRHIEAFCKAHGITYFLSSGTLLGAIRHKGYIPWDDDIDIMMSREEYDKLLKIYPQQATTPYKIYTPADANYPFPFAKIGDTRTTIREASVSAYDTGVNVDIFPMDHFPDDAKEQKSFVKRIQFFRNLLEIKELKTKASRGIIKNAITIAGHIVLTPISSNSLANKINKAAQKYNSQDTHYMGNVVWGVGLRAIVPSQAFAGTTPVTFEGEEYPAPVGYDAYLSCAYGDYMQLPPKEKQVTHHANNVYWKD